MMLSSHKAETEFSGEGIPATHEIVYLVKRPLYEFCFAIPKNQVIFESNGGPLLQVYFSGQSQLHALVLIELHQSWVTIGGHDMATAQPHPCTT